MKELCVTKIQRMCFQDGPGIRTTVFLKGCSIHCPWCSNPENIEFGIQKYIKDGKEGFYGMRYASDELVEAICKDRGFWGGEGGVTFSGGEALMQTDALLPILKILRTLSVDVTIETALFVSEKNIELIESYIDRFIVDVKMLNPEECKRVLGGDIKLYQYNVKTLHEKGKISCFRVPCCYEYTFTEENRSMLIDFFDQYPDVPIQLFSIHGLGKEKYKSLGKEMWEAKEILAGDMETFCKKLVMEDRKVEIIRI